MKSFRIVSLILAGFVLFTQAIIVPIHISKDSMRLLSPNEIILHILGIPLAILMCLAVNGALKKITWAIIGLLLGLGSIGYILGTLSIEDYSIALVFHGICCVYFSFAILTHPFPLKL